MSQERISEPSSFSRAIQAAATARNFASIDDDVQAVSDRNDAAIAAGITVAEETYLISDPDDVPTHPGQLSLRAQSA